MGRQRNMASATRTELAVLKSAMADLPRVKPVDMDTTRRLSRHAQVARLEMGEARWAELNAEWE